MSSSKIVINTIAGEELIKNIVAKQIEGKLSDYKFANKLGVTRANWQAIRTHRRLLNNLIINAITRIYGNEFDALILAYHHENCSVKEGKE